MAGIIFHDWCNHNELRNYPIKDGASRVDVEGRELPNDFLVDANIWLPKSAGTKVMVSSACSTIGVVSVTFVAYGVGSGSVPICAVTVPKPIERFRRYPVDAFYPGVGGWVSFGSAAMNRNDIITTFFSGKDCIWDLGNWDDVGAGAQYWDCSFQASGDTELVPKVIRAYDDLPLLSIGKKDRAKALTGLVTLRGAGDVEVLACTEPWPDPLIAPDFLLNPRYQRYIDGAQRDCIVARLIGTPADYENLYTYAGPCEGTPEDNNCDRRLLQKINGVSADCDGNITIETVNIPTANVVNSDGKVIGLSLEYPVGMIDVCDPTKGLEPRKRDDLCAPSSSSSASLIPPSSMSQISYSSQSLSSLLDPCTITVPFIDRFDSLGCWNPIHGSWALDMCQLQGSSGTGWGLLIRERTNTYGHVFKVQMNIRSSGSSWRSYFIFGRTSNTNYWFVEYDAASSRMYIGRRVGPFVVAESGSIVLTGPVDTYLLLQVQIAAISGTITTWLDGVPGPTVTPVLGTLTDGMVGLGVRASTALFDNFCIDYAGVMPDPGCGSSRSSSSVIPVVSSSSSVIPVVSSSSSVIPVVSSSSSVIPVLSSASSVSSVSSLSSV